MTPAVANKAIYDHYGEFALKHGIKTPKGGKTFFS
jgi:hypothetical protein